MSLARLYFVCYNDVKLQAINAEKVKFSAVQSEPQSVEYYKNISIY